MVDFCLQLFDQLHNGTSVKKNSKFPDETFS